VHVNNMEVIHPIHLSKNHLCDSMLNMTWCSTLYKYIEMLMETLLGGSLFDKTILVLCTRNVIPLCTLFATI
jgi:hypothetical protein